MDNIKLSQSCDTKITNLPFRGKLTIVKNSVLYMNRPSNCMSLKNKKYRENIKFCQLIIKGPKLLTKNHNKMSVVTLQWTNFHIPFIHSYSVDPRKVTEIQIQK